MHAEVTFSLSSVFVQYDLFNDLGTFSDTSKGDSTAQLHGRNSLLSIEPLNSIIESEDNERLLESDLSTNQVAELEQSLSYISVDDVKIEDVEGGFDTDLEEDFPGVNGFFSVAVKKMSLIS